MILIRLAVASLFMYSTATLAGEQKINLCNASEKIIFSCAIAKKIVSLCSTPTLTAKSGQLTYRFGIPGNVPDLEFSNNDSGPALSFTSYFESWAKGSFSSISFKRGEYSYTLYNRMAAFESDDRSNGGGVQVFRKGNQAADLWCKDETINDKIWENLHDLGLPVTSTP